MKLSDGILNETWSRFKLDPGVEPPEPPADAPLTWDRIVAVSTIQETVPKEMYDDIVDRFLKVDGQVVEMEAEIKSLDAEIEDLKDDNDLLAEGYLKVLNDKWFVESKVENQSRTIVSNQKYIAKQQKTIDDLERYVGLLEDQLDAEGLL